MIKSLGFQLVWLFLLSGIAQAQVFEPAGNPAEFEKIYQKRIKLDTINGVYIPKNTEDAFAQLNKKIDARSRDKFMRTSEDTISTIAVRSLGKWMIMNWSFYEGSRLAAFLKAKGVYHPEDQAAFLVVGYYRFLNNLPLKESERIKQFQDKRKEEVKARNLKGTTLSEKKLPKKEIKK